VEVHPVAGAEQLLLLYNTRKTMFLKVIAILAFFAAAVIAKDGADFIIIASPPEYVIYNQYEQPLSGDEKAVFAPYSPFRIVQKDMMLGDQITHALKFAFQQRMYYLLKNDDGKFTGEKSSSGRKIIRDVEPKEDTIESMATGLTMVSGEGRVIAVPKGTRMERIFRSGPRYYCSAIFGRTTYGWSSLEPRYAWRNVDKGISGGIPAQADTGLSEMLRQRILKRFASANESYKAFFNHFNSLSNDERAVPAWFCEKNGSRMACRLTGSSLNCNQLSESIKVLEQDIGNLLSGTGFKESGVNGAIVIEKRGIDK
jgi:hypothetical protein